MKRTLIIILSCLAVLAVNAQALRQATPSGKASTVRHDVVSVKGNQPNLSSAKPQEQKVSRRMSRGNVVLDANSKKLLPDTVYSFSTTKQYGWLAPLGILTKEQASHRNFSYRFTHRNAKGHWGKMELIDGYGKFTTGLMATYILKYGTDDTDSLANKEWAEKVDSACVFEFIADPVGEKVIQERAYDKEMNLIYIFSRTPIGKNKSGRHQYVGSYKDSYGLPAEMRRDTTYTFTYGTLVMLTEDKWGNDSVIEYMDAKGQKKVNSDGAAMEIYEYDEVGRKVRQYSCDSDGKPMIDSWGNCGLEFTWNKDHTEASVMYLDNSLKPMRMPALLSDGFQKGVIKQLYYYDEYKREIGRRFVDDKGNPDINFYGAHKRTTTFDEKGNALENRWYDRDENLALRGDLPIAVTKATYTPEGNTQDLYFFDENEQPLYRPSHFHCEYDANGTRTLTEKYEYNDGKESLYAKEGYEKYSNYILKWNDDFYYYYRIDSLDNKGRTFYSGWFDTDGDPETFDGRACERTTYIDEASKTTILETEYDSDGNPTGDDDDIHKYIYVVDSINCSKTVFKYDLQGDLIESAIIEFDKNFAQPLAMYDSNAFGIKTRCGLIGPRMYKSLYYQTPKGEVGSFIAKDEFDEPDYNDSSYEIYYYKRVTKYSDVNYDEDNNVITDPTLFKDELPKVMSIEVTDSSAYCLGLRDNDLILLYGDYYNDLEQPLSVDDFRSDWTIHSVLDAQKARRMVVFRIEDAKTNRFGLVEIKGLKGTPSELGFNAHIRYLTAKQKSRIMQAIHDNEVSNASYISSSDKHKTKWQGDNFIILAYPDLFQDSRKHPFARQIKDPAVLMASCLEKRGMSWSLPQGKAGCREAIDDLSNEELPVDYFFTKDMESISSIKSTSAYGLGGDLIIENVSDEIYNNLLNLSPQAENLVSQLLDSALHKTNLSHRLKPYEFFSMLSKKPGVMYASRAINFINLDSLWLPKVFNDLEMVYIGKVQSEDLYNSVVDGMGSMIDMTGYERLPHFLSGDLALVKKDGDRLFSEVILVYVCENDLRVYYQKGCFTYEELMALQRLFGYDYECSLFDISDTAAEIPLVHFQTDVDGQAHQAGIEGNFVLLEYDGWNLSKGRENLKEMVESTKQNRKRIVLMPIHWNEDDSFSHFGEPQWFLLDNGALGMSYSDWNTTKSLYERVASAYEKFNRIHKKKIPAKASALLRIDSLHRLKPHVFFSKLRESPEVMYTSHPISYINNGSFKLPKCFNNFEMVLVGKAQSEVLYNRLKDELGNMIDTTGYTRLPHFFSGDLVLVKKDGDQLFSEVLLVDLLQNGARIFYQKGCFSYEELMALQRLFGDGSSSYLFDDLDVVAEIPLVLFQTEGGGLARQAGIEGEFVLLEYNGWNLSNGKENLNETIENAEQNHKRIVLMPIQRDEDDHFECFGEPQLYELGEGILGMRYDDWTVSETLFKRAASAYEKFKRIHKKDYK